MNNTKSHSASEIYFYENLKKFFDDLIKNFDIYDIDYCHVSMMSMILGDLKYFDFIDEYLTGEFNNTIGSSRKIDEDHGNTFAITSTEKEILIYVYGCRNVFGDKTYFRDKLFAYGTQKSDDYEIEKKLTYWINGFKENLKIKSPGLFNPSPQQLKRGLLD